jgi:hypothetical protein
VSFQRPGQEDNVVAVSDQYVAIYSSSFLQTTPCLLKWHQISLFNPFAFKLRVSSSDRLSGRKEGIQSMILYKSPAGDGEREQPELSRDMYVPTFMTSRFTKYLCLKHQCEGGVAGAWRK